MLITRRRHNKVVSELKQRIRDLEQASEIKDSYNQELLLTVRPLWTTNQPDPLKHIALHGRTLK